MAKPITWTNERRKLSDLIPWSRNPRQIREDQARRLDESLDEFGQVDVIAIGPNNEVYNGHQRLNVWTAEHGGDFTIDVRVASRSLTEKEREKLTVFLHRGAMGEWDFNALSDFDVDDLLDWGFAPFELGLDAEDVDYDELWQGMPEFENEDAFGAVSTLKVHFASEEAIEEFARLVGQTVNAKTKFIWYPKQEKANLKAIRWEDESQA